MTAAACRAPPRTYRQLLASDGVLPTWRLGTFDKAEATLRHRVARLRTARELPTSKYIRGLVFDPELGRLR
jgi:carbonic anhydrase